MVPYVQQNVINSGQFIVKDLMYIPSGQYHPMMVRPYVAHLHGEAIDNISNRMMENNSGSITPGIVSGIANSIIRPSINYFTSAVDSNWISTPKYIFLLIVTEITSTGTETNYYIYGHTSHDGITSSGAVDPAMRHYVNNVIETMSYNYTTPTGVFRKEKINKIYHIANNGNTEYMYLQRPYDVIEKIKLNQINSNILGDDANWSVGSFNANSQLNKYSDKIASSMVENNITTHYISRILDAGIKEQVSSQVFLNDYHVPTNSSSSIVEEPYTSENYVLRALSRTEGYMNSTSSFGMGSLSVMDPTIMGRFKVLNITKDYQDPTITKTPEVGDYWTGNDPVTSKAYELIESSVSMVLKFGFSKMYFTASNMTNPMHTPDVFISNFNSFVNLDDVSFTTLLDLFKTNYISDVFLNEVSTTGFDLHMEVYVDILGTSKIYLQYAGFPGNWYTIPTFANALFAPILSIDEGALTATADGLQRAIEEISQNIKPNNYRNMNF